MTNTFGQLYAMMWVDQFAIDCCHYSLWQFMRKSMQHWRKLCASQHVATMMCYISPHHLGQHLTERAVEDSQWWLG